MATFTGIATGSPATISGLPPGNWSFTVQAQGSAGTSGSSAASNVVAVGGPAAAKPLGGPGGLTYTQHFADEFPGTDYDRSVWRQGWFSSDGGATSGPVNTSGYESAMYADDHVSVAGGILTFTVGPNTTGRKAAGTTTVYPNVGAQLTTDPNQGGDYLSPGVDYYLECSAQMPRDSGSGGNPQPAFWQDPESWPFGFEVDVVEAYGADFGNWHVHYPASADQGPNDYSQQAPGGSTTVAGATTGFHTYAALVEGPRAGLTSGRITFYYDGAQAGSITPDVAVPDVGRYLIVGTSSGGTALSSPVTMKVEHIRVWTYTGIPALDGD